jgi:hypothetical protein
MYMGKLGILAGNGNLEEDKIFFALLVDTAGVLVSPPPKSKPILMS